MRVEEVLYCLMWGLCKNVSNLKCETSYNDYTKGWDLLLLSTHYYIQYVFRNHNCCKVNSVSSYVCTINLIPTNIPLVVQLFSIELAMVQESTSVYAKFYRMLAMLWPSG